jgi:hypothetical protein
MLNRMAQSEKKSDGNFGRAAAFPVSVSCLVNYEPRNRIWMIDGRLRERPTPLAYDVHDKALLRQPRRSFKCDFGARNWPNIFKFWFLTEQSTGNQNNAKLKLTFYINPENPGFSPLEAPLSTRFPIRNGKSGRPPKVTVRFFFWLRHSIQHENLH